jgi:ABC-type multidrug transport system ATPase subunit
MMSLLVLERVAKSYARGQRVALVDASLAIDAGEMVVVIGERQSGRSTLLRIAAGLEAPDCGVVQFQGRDLPLGGRLGGEIRFCRTTFRPDMGRTVFEQLFASQLACRVEQTQARALVLEVLKRVDAVQCAQMAASEMKIEEAVRVAVARALTSKPRLLVFDEPTIGVGSAERDGILELLRSLADEGIAVLTSTGEGTGCLGAHRVVSLGKGKLSGELLPLPASASVRDLAGWRLSRGAGSGVA